MKTSSSLLGELSKHQFLRDYWQKKPLLVRQAVPQFQGLLDPRELIALACTEDIQSRLVIQRNDQWEVHHGPFKPKKFDHLRKHNWTVLVQGVNHHLHSAATLLQLFDFIPHARMDDLMISYAPKGGGVGPHFDSYDVFLLQGLGKRHWQISAQKDYKLVNGAPLKILQNFHMEHDWILESGDMLYLPPHYAHNGIAENDCMTYSIGFRAPTHQELAEQFLVYLQDKICLDGIYSDPDLKIQPHPSEISSDMLRQVEMIIQRIKWNKNDITHFLGSYLSEPKSNIFFDPPEEPLSHSEFEQAMLTGGIQLALKTQMLCHDNIIYMNGMAHAVDKPAYRELRALADVRRLNSRSTFSQETLELLYIWYQNGYVFPGPF